MLSKIFLAILIIGGVNWGLIGLLNFDLVAFLFGGETSLISRIVYTLVGVSAVFCLPTLFADNTRSDLESNI